jgi:hypothetical protein
VRFQVLMAASIKIRVFCAVTQCSLGVERRFRGVSIMMEAVRTSETSVYSETTWHVALSKNKRLCPFCPILSMNPFSHFSIKTPVIYAFLFDLHTTGSSFIFMFLKNLRLTEFLITRGLSTS